MNQHNASISNEGGSTTRESHDDGPAGADLHTGSSAYSDSARGRFQSIESDGVIYQRERDAPGQNCIYIPPGNHDEEKYRLATFLQYPTDVPVKYTDLAAAGFYFTGYKDRVKCFSCGIAVENWMMGDDAMDKKWHKSDCRMAFGRESRNVSVSNFRSIFRALEADAAAVSVGRIGVHNKNYQAPLGNSAAFGNHAGAPNSRIPNDMSDVTSTFRRVNLSDSFPTLVLANVMDAVHESLLKSLNLKSEVDRRKTYLKWPSYPAPFLPSDLSKEGFFYLGNLDRTQCFSCSGVLRNWAPYDNVRDQHEKHFPNCRIVRRMDSGNIPLTDDERKDADDAEKIRIAALLPSTDSLVEPPDPPAEEQRHLAEYFPCTEPVNPHMQRLDKRIETFAHGWQREKIRASPEAIAKAGFFYLGESDKTKCFYCNGGLQNWDPNDEPWTEHAKWFPGCEFVLRRKGVDFVRCLAEAHPNLNRPYIRNPVSFDIPPREVGRTSPPRSMEVQSSNLDLDVVESMGFTKEQIQQAIEKKRGRGGYQDTQELIDYLLEGGDTVNSTGDIPPSSIAMEQNGASGPALVQVQAGHKREAVSGIAETVTKKTRTSSPAMPLDAEDEKLQRSLQQLEETGLCRICKQSPVGIVLIPCGHLSACSDCAPAIRRCPICDTKVTSTVKVFRV